MNFFDDLKKNAKTAADATKKKTNELTAIAKATMAVKSEENKMAECYKDIGRLFYEAEHDGVNNAEEIASYIMQIDKSKAKVQKLKKTYLPDLHIHLQYRLKMPVSLRPLPLQLHKPHHLH